MAIYFRYEIQYILYILQEYSKHMGGTDHQDQNMNKYCHSGGRKHVVDKSEYNGIDHYSIETLAKSRRRCAVFNCTKCVSSQCSKCDIGLF